MKKIFFCLAVSLFAVCACNKDNATESTPSASLMAVMGTDTKTEIVPSGSEGSYTYTMKWTGNEVLHVFQVPTEYPDVPDASINVSGASNKIVFNYASGTGTSAIFNYTSSGSSWDGFDAGERYIVMTEKHAECTATEAVYVYRNGAQPSTAINFYGVKMPMATTQQYNPSDAVMGLTKDYIPVCGIFEVGGANGSEPSSITMYSEVSIVRLRLTNQTGSAQTIKKIVLSQSEITNLRNIGGAQFIEFRAANDYSPSFKGTCYNNTGSPVTVDCGESGTALAAGATKVFSFVVIGAQNPGTLTWKVYNMSDTQVGADITATPGNLELCKVYTANRNLAI